MAEFFSKTVGVGGPLTEETLMQAAKAVYDQKWELQPTITTRAQKNAALDWREARYNKLISEGQRPTDAFAQADREAANSFIGPHFRPVPDRI